MHLFSSQNTCKADLSFKSCFVCSESVSHSLPFTLLSCLLHYNHLYMSGFVWHHWCSCKSVHNINRTKQGFTLSIKTPEGTINRHWCFQKRFGFGLWSTQSVLCLHDTQLESVMTIRTRKEPGLWLVGELLSESVCAVLALLIWAINHYDRKNNDRREDCISSPKVDSKL